MSLKKPVFKKLFLKYGYEIINIREGFILWLKKCLLGKSEKKK